AEHRDPGGAHTEGKAGIAFGVVADRLEDGGIDHPRPHDLEPAGALAGTAPATAADEAAHIDLRARFGEGEERRTEPDVDARTEDATHELRQRGLEIDEGDPLVDRQTLDLFEGR